MQYLRYPLVRGPMGLFKRADERLVNAQRFAATLHNAYPLMSGFRVRGGLNKFTNDPTGATDGSVDALYRLSHATNDNKQLALVKQDDATWDLFAGTVTGAWGILEDAFTDKWMQFAEYDGELFIGSGGMPADLKGPLKVRYNDAGVPIVRRWGVTPPKNDATSANLAPSVAGDATWKVMTNWPVGDLPDATEYEIFISYVSNSKSDDPNRHRVSLPVSLGSFTTGGGANSCFIVCLTSGSAPATLHDIVGFNVYLKRANVDSNPILYKPASRPYSCGIAEHYEDWFDEAAWNIAAAYMAGLADHNTNDDFPFLSAERNAPVPLSDLSYASYDIYFDHYGDEAYETTETHKLDSVPPATGGTEQVTVEVTPTYTPPKFVAAWQQRLWTAWDQVAYVWPSRIGNPEAFDDGAKIKIRHGESKKGAGICPALRSMVVATTTSMHAIVGSGIEDGYGVPDYSVQDITSHHGCCSPGSLVAGEFLGNEALYWADRDGFYVWRGGNQIMRISDAVRDIFKYQENGGINDYETIRAVFYDTKLHVVFQGYDDDGETLTQQWYVYDADPNKAGEGGIGPWTHMSEHMASLCVWRNPWDTSKLVGGAATTNKLYEMETGTQDYFTTRGEDGTNINFTYKSPAFSPASDSTVTAHLYRILVVGDLDTGDLDVSVYLERSDTATWTDDMAAVDTDQTFDPTGCEGVWFEVEITGNLAADAVLNEIALLWEVEVDA